MVLRKLIDSDVLAERLGARPRPLPVKGDVLEIQPANQETAYRISFFGDLVGGHALRPADSGEVLGEVGQHRDLAGHGVRHVAADDRARRNRDPHELDERLKQLEGEDMLEAHRLRQRTEYDLEMMKEKPASARSRDHRGTLVGAPGTHPFACSTTRRTW